MLIVSQNMVNYQKIKGSYGITRQKLEIPRGYKGKEGIFEYIKEPNGNINHCLFKPNK